MLLLPARVKRLSLATRDHQRRPWRGGAWPCSGSARLTLVVASSPEHLRVMEKMRHELGKVEVCGAVLAMVNLTTTELR
jgi:hypothetical protein